MLSGRARTAIAIILTIVVASWAAQTIGILGESVSADINSSIQLSESPSSILTSGTNSTNQTLFQVQPTSKTIAAGSYVEFSVNVYNDSSANVLLITRKMPFHSMAIFTPQSGLANPNFHSSLTIVTAADSPVGTYNITVLALAADRELMADISLRVTPNESGTVQANGLETAFAKSSLSILLETDHNYYSPNATVNVRGAVIDESSSAVTAAHVSIQVDGPSGSELVFTTGIATDAAGVFRTSLKIPTNAAAGTYTIFASANKTGFASATTHTTFVLNSSSTPSVMIAQVYATDTTGNYSGEFSTNQTLLIWVVLQNDGAPTQGVVWIQILDPKGNPVSIQLQTSTLDTARTVKIAFRFSAPKDSASGIYTANALVSDKLISQGGTFLASGSTQFVLSR